MQASGPARQAISTHRLRAFYARTVGKKVAMAISGFAVVGWLLLHMLGNVTIFAGRTTYNEYAAFLAQPPLLWTQRVVLITALIVHVESAASLWRRNAQARPRGYRQRKDLATTYAARSMRYGGVALLAFLIFHLLQLTVGVTGWLGYAFVRGDVYNNAVLGFMHPAVVAFYLVALLALGLHLYHGTWSMLQTLGWEESAPAGLRRRIALAVTLAITLGLASVSIAVQAGWLMPEQAEQLENARQGGGQRPA